MVQVKTNNVNLQMEIMSSLMGCIKNILTCKLMWGVFIIAV